METEQNLSKEESLAIISKMISEAKGGYSNKGSFFFLLWGWTITAAYVCHYLLATVIHYHRPYMVWLIVIPTMIVSVLYSRKLASNSGYSTHLSKVIMWSWYSFGFASVLIVLFGSKINYQITPMMLMFMAMPTFITGIALKFKPLILGAVVFWASVVVCFLVNREVYELIGAFAMLFGYLIPGYMLKNK